MAELKSTVSVVKLFTGAVPLAQLVPVAHKAVPAVAFHSCCVAWADGVASSAAMALARGKERRAVDRMRGFTVVAELEIGDWRLEIDDF